MINQYLLSADANFVNEMTFPDMLVRPRDLYTIDDLTRGKTKLERMIEDLEGLLGPERW